MSNADEIARVREIKSLLDRIQQLPLATGALEERALVAQWANSAEGFVAPGTAARAHNSATISPWLFVMATALNTIVAAVLAVLITLGVVNREPPRDGEQSASILPGAGPAAAPRTITTGAIHSRSKDPSELALARPVELLPIGSPGQPLRLEALKPSRLPLHVRPEEAAQETYILVLSGLPTNATLSGASRMGSNSWLLPPGSLTQLDIVMAEWSTSLIEVGVELRRTNGVVAAHNRAWLFVPPPRAPQGVKLDEAAIKEMLQSGDRLLGRGDVAAARALYERAAAMGSGPAALALGSTYDPGRLWSLGVFGMVGNKEQARHWYARADQLGHPEAKDRLKALRE